MKKFFISLFVLVFSTSLWSAEFQEIALAYNFYKAQCYQVVGAQGTEDVFTSFQQIKIREVEESEYRFDGSNLHRISLQEAIELLSTDHRPSTGDRNWTEEELDELRRFYRREAGYLDLAKLEIWDNYYSGTGITGYILIYNQRSQTLCSLEKHIYSE